MSTHIVVASVYIITRFGTVPVDGERIYLCGRPQHRTYVIFSLRVLLHKFLEALHVTVPDSYSRVVADQVMGPI